MPLQAPAERSQSRYSKARHQHQPGLSAAGLGPPEQPFWYLSPARTCAPHKISSLLTHWPCLMHWSSSVKKAEQVTAQFFGGVTEALAGLCTACSGAAVGRAGARCSPALEPAQPLPGSTRSAIWQTPNPANQTANLSNSTPKRQEGPGQGGAGSVVLPHPSPAGSGCSPQQGTGCGRHSKAAAGPLCACAHPCLLNGGGLFFPVDIDHNCYPID